MKNILLILLLASPSVYGQSKAAQSFGALTAADRKNYVINIDEQDISKPSSTSFDPKFPSSKVFIELTLNVNNNSSDTLKYMSMWCSFTDIVKTDNIKLHIMGNYCGSDYPQVNFVAPHNSKTLLLRVVYKKATVATGTPFKVGMSIYKYVNKQQLKGFNSRGSSIKDDTTNVIWSNTVEIPGG